LNRKPYAQIGKLEILASMMKGTIQRVKYIPQDLYHYIRP